jgi:hypothetical protein
MKIDWRNVAHIAAGITGMFVPGAVAVEQSVEGIVDAKTGEEKAAQVVSTAIASLNTYAGLGGKVYATPRVVAVINRLNNDSVELLNALAEAHRAQ